LLGLRGSFGDTKSPNIALYLCLPSGEESVFSFGTSV